MAGTYSPETLAELVQSGLLVGAGVYRRRADGSLQYDGERPGQGWHAHGYMPRLLVACPDGGRVTVWKKRWLRVKGRKRPRTCHSRPPDDIASVWFSATVVVLKLWAWLDGEAGAVHYEEPSCVRELGGSRRTVQRWLARGLPLASQTLQSIRRAVIERSEPRPAEQLFPGGLPPPEELRRRRWRTPDHVSQLWQACAFVIGGAAALNVNPPVLLAEARRRQVDPNKFLI